MPPRLPYLSSSPPSVPIFSLQTAAGHLTKHRFLCILCTCIFARSMRSATRSKLRPESSTSTENIKAAMARPLIYLWCLLLAWGPVPAWWHGASCDDAVSVSPCCPGNDAQQHILAGSWVVRQRGLDPVLGSPCGCPRLDRLVGRSGIEARSASACHVEREKSGSCPVSTSRTDACISPFAGAHTHAPHDADHCPVCQSLALPGGELPAVVLPSCRSLNLVASCVLPEGPYATRPRSLEHSRAPPSHACSGPGDASCNASVCLV